MLYPRNTATRERVDVDTLWQMVFDHDHEGLDKDYPSQIPTHAREIAANASFNEQVTDRLEYTYMDWVWYFKRIRVPRAWKERRVWIRFGAVTFRCDVYLNGELLGSHEGGYTPFEFEITGRFNQTQENLLVLRVDNLLDYTTCPQGQVPSSAGGVASWRVGNWPDVHYDFFPFTGIHRPVVLYATDPARLEQIRLTTTKIDEQTARACFTAETSGTGDTLRISVPELSFSRDFRLDNHAAEDEIEFTGITPWSPEEPRLYDIIIHVMQGSDVADEYILAFGFRTVEVTEDDLLLNGKPVYLRGFGRHEDLTVIGKGLSIPFLVKDFNLMKWIGANSFRTSHYPYSEECIQMADRLGFMVISETDANTLSLNAVKDEPDAYERLARRHRDHIRELIERDFNHACVIAWSLGNECETYVEAGKGYFREKVEYARTLDNSRPICFVINSRAEEELEADCFDVICLNTYPAWYGRDCGKYEKIDEMLSPRIESFREHFKKPILISEFGADALPGLHDEYDLMWTEEYQCRMVDHVIKTAEKYSHCIGVHVWNFADFKVGQHTGRIVLNWKGVFTRDRHPKMVAHELKRRWTD